MEYLQEIGKQFSGMQITDYLDILVVACLIYWLVPLFRTTGTGKIARVVVAVLAVAWIADILNLHTMSFILEQLLTVGLIAIVVLFQPELRRMIDHVNNVQLKKIIGSQHGDDRMLPAIEQTVRACEEMSRERVGALIVFARDSYVGEYVKTGTTVDATPSEHLIRNIFFPKASLHDGAMIIREGRIEAAGCVLPLSDSDRLSADLGTRHRSAVGMSEATDAVVVVVSEETGVISVAVGGLLKRHLAPQMLERLLKSELCSSEDENGKSRLLQKLKKKKGGDIQ